MEGRDPILAALAEWPTLAELADLPRGLPQATSLVVRNNAVALRLVIRLTLADGRQLILKQELRGREEPAGHFTRSLDAQEIARLRMSGNVVGLRVPKILARLPERGLALMEYFEGDSAAALVEAAQDNAQRRDILRACGHWLADFHRSTSDGHGPYRTQFALDHQRKLRAEIAAGALRVAEPALFLRLSHQVEAGAGRWDGQPARHAQRHGDYSLRNVLIGGNRVAAIDFRPLQTAPVGHDVARLLVDFAALYAEHRKIPDGQLLQGPYRSAFFRAYDFAGADDASVGFLCGIQILQDWLRIPVREADRNLLQIVRLQGLVASAMRLFPDMRQE